MAADYAYVAQSITSCTGLYRVKEPYDNPKVDPVVVLVLVHAIGDGKMHDQFIVGLPQDDIGVSGVEYDDLRREVAGYVTEADVVRSADGTWSLRPEAKDKDSLFWT